MGVMSRGDRREAIFLDDADPIFFNTTNQLTNVRYNADQVWTGNPVNWSWWVDYGYTPDRLNRWYVNDNASFAWVGVNALNQYTSVGSQGLGYDNRFNLATYDGATFTYNARNQLVSATKNGATVAFTYDGLGRCVRRVNGTTTHLIAYDGWKPMLEWAGDGSYYAYNVYGAGPDEILWRFDSRPGWSPALPSRPARERHQPVERERKHY